MRKCNAISVYLGRSYPNLNYGITHELAHVYTLVNGVTSSPDPLGAAYLYFHALTFQLSLEESSCTPIELFAYAGAILTLGDRFQSSYPYWSRCSITTDTVTEQALDVVRSATVGQMPSWFADT